MRDVVVIGGGLSGLSACYELEKQQLPYTVIEVKRRLGGGIRSTFEAGFIMERQRLCLPRPRRTDASGGALPRGSNAPDRR